MKVSVAWIFDHIDADRHAIAIDNLVDRFNKTTAEIEGVLESSIDCAQLSAVQVVAVSQNKITVRSDEWNAQYDLPFRVDACKDSWFMVTKTADGAAWALATAFGGTRQDLLLPEVHESDDLRTGEWKKTIEEKDHILVVDNKSITHRPDMWGHRGFAREIAAMFQLPLLPLEKFISTKKITEHKADAPATEHNPYGITIADTDVCSRFATLFIHNVTHTPSLLPMMSRLIRIDNRAIDALVDATNYVMLDIGHPMHAFDADKLQSQELTVRRAKEKETLTLLDGQDITLTAEDIIIADGKIPTSLAGVMGGAHSGITAQTSNVLLEAACFDAATIRRSSQRHKVRTEASARFEKSLDPLGNLVALQRFVYLLQDGGVPMQVADTITSVGVVPEKHTITVAHAFIEKRLGVTLAADFVQETLTRIGFTVQAKDGDYHIVVPSFRATKDVQIKEDIVEEIARFFGYDTITPIAPLLPATISDCWAVKRVRLLKHTLAYSLHMREVANYALFDESFLQTINFDPGDTAAVQEPVSENWRRLVTTLMPHLFKLVVQHRDTHDTLRFFEWGRIWELERELIERKLLAGIMVQHKKPLDFYDAKEQLEQLFAVFNLPVSWQQVTQAPAPWYAPYQSAYLVHEGTRVGIAGVISTPWMQKIGQGSGFIFECDGDYLLNYKPALKRYVPASKFPAVTRDVSMLVPLSVTVDTVKATIAGIDERIGDITLVDFFQKEEWHDKKAVTISCVITDYHKTLTKQEIDTIWQQVEQAVCTTLGAQIR